ncbi:hypothetical protein QC763_302980 [Podospora pseudopauciseta]|uniref:Uncharacterized protein n=1 Tax=Podospora pseudopauciseta TaxID=2093780 RepID=A0ABR0HFU2_9PEZI|nr:hypothetical protein QC763_302980 [Podospora pseudopauciseta]
MSSQNFPARNVCFAFSTIHLPSETILNTSPSEPQRDLVSRDWIYSPRSNIPIASDKGWFTSLVPFQSQVTHTTSESSSPVTLAVSGIGEVSVNTKQNTRCKEHPYEPGTSTDFTLRIRRPVLLVPDFWLQHPDAQCPSFGQ